MALARITVDTVIQLSYARRDVEAWRELLEQALALLAERERQLKSARATVAHQRLEIRAIVAGRTIAEQRQRETPTTTTDSQSVTAAA